MLEYKKKKYLFTKKAQCAHSFVHHIIPETSQDTLNQNDQSVMGKLISSYY